MIAKAVSVLTCGTCFLYTSYVLCNLTYFLSNHNENKEAINPSETDENIILATLWSLMINMLLLSAFTLQHSLMASDIVKQTFVKLNIEYMNRSIYNVTSAACLHLLLDRWQFMPWMTIWKVDTLSSIWTWSLFTGFHVLAWSIIYSGCLMMDISELAGLKQVYYKFSARPTPMAMKSRELSRYYSHMRHPSFTGFLIILWIHPFMTIDRLLIASIFTAYMAMMWTIDQEDYNYHASLVRRKQRELF